MKKRILSLLTAAFIGLISFNSCSDDNDSDQKPSLDYRIVVVNEGNFMSGNADISVIGRDNKITNKVFESTNNRPLGDVGQSISLINDKLFVTLNNSAKIEVMDANTFKQISTITFEEKSPLYIQQINDTLALVGGYHKSLSIINTKTDKEIETIEMGTSSFQMIKTGGKVLINTGAIVVYDIASKTIEKTIDAELCQTTRFVKDSNGAIWVLTTNGLAQIDPVNLNVTKTLSIENTGLNITFWKDRLDISADGKTLYFSATDSESEADGIYSVSTTASQLPNEPVLPLKDTVTTIYNFAVSPEGTLIICDAIDYSQSGKVFEYSVKGVKLNEWTAGISPQHIFFSDKH